MLATFVTSPIRVIGTLSRHRELTWAMARRDVLEQYAGRVLGALWTIGNPLLLTALYVFLFAYVYPERMVDRGGMEGNATAWILAGLIPWLGFADLLNRSTGAVVNHGNLVRQVVFPIETLPAKAVVAALVPQLVLTVLLIIYSLTLGPGLPWTALLLPLFLAIQTVAMLGTALLLSTFTVFIRDLRELVGFFTTAGLFLAPILYRPEWVESLSPKVRWLLEANPFTHLVRCHREIMYVGAIETPWSWVALVLFATVALMTGAAAFRRCVHSFGDLV
jgi:lipopolysaccharide transport system permease protein